MQIVYVIIVVIAVVGVLSLISKKQRDSSWEGTVTNIQDRTRLEQEDEFRTEKVVAYKTPEGKHCVFVIDTDTYKRTYPDLAVGDRLEKRRGEYLPRASKAV